MNKDKMYAMRHSLAHIMASSIMQLWPHAKLGVGPVIENGFYYDVDLGKTTISEEDFARIEKGMQKIIAQKQPFEHLKKPIGEALTWAQTTHQSYKEELLNDLHRSGTTIAKELNIKELGLASTEAAAVDTVSFYKNGDFIDLCRGPHVENTGEVGAFKIMRVAGAYWRGKETNPQMQRLYGVAFTNQQELDAYLQMLEEAKKRDHRKLGEELKLFFISENVGAGLPLLLPRGETIKHTLMNYMRAKEEERGYQYVATPVLTQSALYERSGHASYYLENMYGTQPDEEGNSFYIKPMNCPHHHMVYEKLVESYRDLPLRLSEHAGLYRYELSGTLTGLIRMRGPITQNDSHIYVTPQQVEAEFMKVLELFEEVYRETAVKDYWFRLSLPDFSKEKYAGAKERWQWAGDLIRKCLQASRLPFVEQLDEAAFYGPKVDVQIKNVLGKEDSIATVQLDIVVPERMKLTYVDSEGVKQYPLVIHKSIMGAFERFMAFMLEQTAGKLPTWLSPEQVRILTINQEPETIAFAKTIQTKGQELSLRVQIDSANESVGKKIRAAELMRIPYTIVIGQKEIDTKQLDPRIRSDLKVVKAQNSTYTVESFLENVAREVHNRTDKSLL